MMRISPRTFLETVYYYTRPWLCIAINDGGFCLCTFVGCGFFDFHHASDALW